MKIHSLQLQNFRGFEKLDLALDPSLTLLVGENGAGKTAVLEGLVTALSAFLSYLTRNSPHYIRAEDVRVRVFEYEGLLDRQPQWPAHVVASGTIEGKPATWACSNVSDEAPPDSPRQSLGAPGAPDLRDAVMAGQPRALPVVAYYGTHRLWRRQETSKPMRRAGSRFDGYTNALDADANQRQLAEWMFQQTLVELQRRKEVPQLRAVERAACQCIEGASRFFFDVQSQELILVREGAQPLPFSSLSDGYRNMVALVADIAWRASVLNPHFGADAAARSEGIVLIDEIELHLHPRWQRRVLGDLMRTFPRLQFVATTHSPQVLASVRREQVRVLRNNALVDVHPFVEGRDSNSLLEDVLGVPERPEAVRAKIDAMSALFDDEHYDEATKLLDGLEAQLGPDDPAVIRGRWILAHEALPKEHG